MPTEEQLHGIMESLREVTRRAGSGPSTPTKQSPKNSPLKTATPNRFTTASSTNRVTKQPALKMSLKDRIQQVKEKNYRRATLSTVTAPLAVSAPSAPATYAPWSLKDFLDRVASYTYQKYTVDTFLYPKLSPYTLARYGWKCTDENLLQCVTCGGLLAVLCDSIDDDEATRELFQKTVLGFVSDKNHSVRCLWKTKPCAESLGSIMGNIVQLRRDIRAKIEAPEKVEVFVDGKSALEYFKLHQELGNNQSETAVVGELNDSKELTESEPTKSESTETTESEPSIKTLSAPTSEQLGKLILATGWRDSCGMFKCHFCSRTVLTSETFDVIEEHRDWCPYVVEKEDGKPAWWQVLAKPPKESSKKRLSNIREAYFGV
ncbi:hypothetical protein CJU90_5643 [Yarrowia sp. C11]|nr:hypothetical protein CJU90_5643 [Yarrowia sp. C11]KAG5364228.1 hypothetical protein CKK34_3020 [Yarrowia sp. E02]